MYGSSIKCQARRRNSSYVLLLSSPEFPERSLEMSVVRMINTGFCPTYCASTLHLCPASVHTGHWHFYHSRAQWSFWGQVILATGHGPEVSAWWDTKEVCQYLVPSFVEHQAASLVLGHQDPPPTLLRHWVPLHSIMSTYLLMASQIGPVAMAVGKMKPDRLY